MKQSDLTRAIAAATEVAASLDLPADDATVLHNSNKLALRLTPCDVVARVAHVGQEVAQFEVELAQRLAEVGCPAGTLEPRVDPLVYVRRWLRGDAVDLLRARDTAGRTSRLRPVRWSGCTSACARSRCRARRSRIESRRPKQLVASPDLTPELATPMTASFSAARSEACDERSSDRGVREQLLHGEPHPGNVLSTKDGPLFIDLETCCRGPVEFDLAHVPETVSQHYPGVDQGLLHDCRQLVLAMVAAWRWDRGDQFPNGKRAREEFLSALRDGPPWPTLDVMTRRFQDP